jgi:hypothetical protein
MVFSPCNRRRETLESAAQNFKKMFSPSRRIPKPNFLLTHITIPNKIL